MTENQPANTQAKDHFYVFVYGTLKRGHQFNYALADQTFVGEAITTADYRMYDLGDYPGLKEVAPGSGIQVQGEIYQVDQACLRQLDQIEEVDRGLYRRCEVRLTPLKGFSLPINQAPETYIYLPDISGCDGCSDCW